jgi:hypothetical protein
MDGEMEQEIPELPEDGLEKLTDDLRQAAATLTPNEAQYLVDLYYQMQMKRIQAAAQMREAAKAGEPNRLIKVVSGQFERVERRVREAMKIYAPITKPGRWLLSVHGIGPVIAAGLLAHLDVTKAKSASSFWRFAGLDPTAVWKKGEKRPWNAELKTLCWKAGESFVKTCNHEDSYYGQLYKARKLEEIAQNERGENKGTAKAALEAKKYRKETKAKAAYEKGVLPDGQVHGRARRYAVKVFLSHLFVVMYEDHFGTPAPKPWIIEHGGHVHYLEVPKFETKPPKSKREKKDKPEEGTAGVAAVSPA